MRTYTVGDIVLTGRKSQGLVSLAIKLGSKLRHGFRSPHTAWSHSALVISPSGDLAEALQSGVKRTHISKYEPDDIAILPTGHHMSGIDQVQVLAFARAVLDARTRYGILTFIGLAIYCLTGTRVVVQTAGTAICSGFVCDALTRAGWIWYRPPFSMMPADIARQFDEGF